jgi:hypothetical protein
MIKITQVHECTVRMALSQLTASISSVPSATTTRALAMFASELEFLEMTWCPKTNADLMGPLVLADENLMRLRGSLECLASVCATLNI